jgi:hypothetical protein
MNICPCCNHTIPHNEKPGDAAAVPSPGDLSVCFYCAAYLIFEDDISLRLMEVDEVVELPSDTLYELTRLRNIIMNLRVKQETGGDNVYHHRSVS